ncbi:MAG TPA: CvpA family protein [Dehalococcoidia bacterium]|nr:CvpA family protein [Dehalococcoidia bacterium]
MNWLDIVIILVVAGFAVAAYSSGLIREVITLLSVIVGVIIAGQLYDNLATDVLVFMNDRDVADVISFLVLFGAVYLFGQILAYTLKTGASMLMLGWANHIGGALFGLLKGLIVVEVFLIVFAAYPELGLDGSVKSSELSHYFVKDVDWVQWFLPGNFDDRVQAFLLS